MGRHINTEKKDIPIRGIMIAVFISAMLISVSVIGYLVFTSWLSSTQQTTENIAGNMSDSIYEQVTDFMYVPDHINEINYKIIENGILDLSDEILREKFFVGVLSSHNKEIYSFSYGTVNGEYYGARRNENGVIEIMRNDASTGGNSWYYSVKKDMTAGELAVQAGKFDPRTRAWYQAAEASGGPAFSPVYNHFVMDDLAISAAWPIYKNDKLQGVMGTHMLLSGIGAYLRDIVDNCHGYAIILEKNTGYLIANSLGMDNFTVLQDGTLKRYGIGEISNSDIQQAYQKNTKSQDPRFVYIGEKENLFVNIREINMKGIDWVVITAIPEGLLIAPMMQSIRLTLLLAVLALALSLTVYNVVTGRLMRPMNDLLKVSAALSAGDFSKRVKVVRNDEIGIISSSLNNVADKMQFLITNLEENVRERTEELHKINLELEENRNQLQLILDSAAEGIYGIDINGNCIFCNTSSVKLLGYTSQEELLGKNMHWQIHHSHQDGTPFPLDECRIIHSILEGRGWGTDDEVFWKADGTPFYVEYHSYPQIKEGKVVGGVISFMDITDRKKKEKEIHDLNCHDPLTGLYNRRCFEEHRARIDIPDNLPLTVIFADLNGLKMTNDIFGHAAGDQLIKKSSEILQQSCREGDVIARVGGDEFIILLPKTNEENAAKIISRINAGFLDARIAAIKCSISLGCDTKTRPEQSLEEIMANAENAMYRQKTMNRKAVNDDIIETIIETLHTRRPKEKQHSIMVRKLCGEIGAVLHLIESEIDKLKRAGYLHDIGKIVLEDSFFEKEQLSAEEYEEMRQHPIVGYRILNLFDETLDLAEYVYSHHERWDGKGYPSGLKGEQIPLISRIISIAETYERALNRGDLPLEERKKAALKFIEEGAGSIFDPYIAELFVQMMKD